jgi:hypothetical protein
MGYVKAFFVWLGFLAVAVTFGIIRENLLTPALGALGGRAIGTLLVGVIIFGLIYLYIREIKGRDQSYAF